MGGCVSADAATATYLVELVVGEARRHCSRVNVVANGVVRHLAGVLLDDGPPARLGQVAAMTDEEFWVLLMTDPATAGAVRALRADPTTWDVTDVTDAAGSTESGNSAEGSIPFTLRRLYLDLPLVDGAAMATDHPGAAALAALPAVPWHCRIVRRTQTPAVRPSSGLQQR